MAFSFRKNLGVWGERLACAEYLQKGHVLVARNIYNNRGKQMGEIDLIVRSESELIFVEVKTRSSHKFGTGADAITKAKQRKLIKITNWFQRKYPYYKQLRPRIDVCVIETPPYFKPSSNLDKSAVNVIIISDAVTLDY